MLLKDLRTGQRFIFEDRVTPVIIDNGTGAFDPSKTFVYRSVDGGRPVLFCEDSKFEFTAVAGTYNRYVFLLF